MYTPTKEDFAILKKYYEGELSTLMADIREKEERAKSIQSKLKEINALAGAAAKKETINGSTANSNHPSHAIFITWNDRITNVLKTSKKPLKRGEIIEEVLNSEPTLDKSKVSNSIGATLSTAVDKLYRRREDENGQFLYELINA